ncbi:MAG TPA: hypothetical protein VF292_06715 [Rhodanobacteraceae bacterium]
MQRSVVVILAVALGCGVSLGAYAAGNASREVATALIHANVAAKVDALSGVHLHLHHVLNCVLGPHSKEYSAAAEAVSANPCKGLGDGALPDAAHDTLAQRELRNAAHAAERGVASSNLAVAHREARTVVAALDAAQRALKK